MGNYRCFLQGPLPVANYTRIIIPGRFWTRPPSTKSTRMASSATPLHDSLIELAIPDAHAHAIKWYLKVSSLALLQGRPPLAPTRYPALFVVPTGRPRFFFIISALQYLHLLHLIGLRCLQLGHSLRGGILIGQGALAQYNHNASMQATLYMVDVHVHVHT